MLIIKEVQSEVFDREIEILTSILRRSDRVLTEINKLVRTVPLNDDYKFPIILPKNNHVSCLIVRHFHENVKHQGRGITLNEIRSNAYWIVQGTATGSKCICRRLLGATQDQKMADLHIDRVDPCHNKRNFE